MKNTQDCYQNLLCNMVPILHIHHRLHETISLANDSPFKLSASDLLHCFMRSIHRAENSIDCKVFYNRILKYRGSIKSCTH